MLIPYRAPLQENLVLASIGGMLAAVIMTPVDVVKTRIMTGTGGEYTSIPQTLMKIVRCVYACELAIIAYKHCPPVDWGP
jgi:hypothetical protein